MKVFHQYYSFRWSSQYCFSRRDVRISITGLLSCYYSRHIHKAPADLIKYFETWLSEMEQAPLYDDHTAIESLMELLLSFTLSTETQAETMTRVCSISTRQPAFPSTMTAKVMPEKLRSELEPRSISEFSNVPEFYPNSLWR